MSRSAGAGSPVWFHCAEARRFSRLQGRDQHRVTLTGRERPFRVKRGSMHGSRSTWISREYTCSCGHTGWSNHVDLAQMAGAPTGYEPRQEQLDRLEQKP